MQGSQFHRKNQLLVKLCICSLCAEHCLKSLHGMFTALAFYMPYKLSQWSRITNFSNGNKMVWLYQYPRSVRSTVSFYLSSSMKKKQNPALFSKMMTLAMLVKDVGNFSSNRKRETVPQYPGFQVNILITIPNWLSDIVAKYLHWVMRVKSNRKPIKVSEMFFYDWKTM